MKTMIFFILVFFSNNLISKTVSYTLTNSTPIFKDSALKIQMGTVHNNARIFLVNNYLNSKHAQYITIGKHRAWIRVKDIILAYHPAQYYNNHVNYDRREVINQYIKQIFSD